MSTEPIPPDTIPIPPVIPTPPDGVPYVAPLYPPMTAPIDPCLPSGTTKYGILPCDYAPTLPATGAASCGIVVAATLAVCLGKLLHSTSHRKG